MVAVDTPPQAPVAQRIEQVSGIRPVTLLIAFGIVLIIAILIATGIAANHLRRQALATTERELATIDNVLVEASSRSLNVIDARLSEIAAALLAAQRNSGAGLRDAASEPQTAALLRTGLERLPRLDGLAILAADGSLVAHAGAVPADADALRKLAVPHGAAPGHQTVLGGPIDPPRSSGADIVLVHSLGGSQGAPSGVIIGLMPAADLVSLFASTPLPADAAIELLRPDGTTLVRYPASAIVSREGDLGPLFQDPNVTMVRRAMTAQGAWRIEALRALPGYPAAVVVGRDASRALAEWERQGLWFGGFALAGAIVIACMVYLIARQVRTQDALGAARADHIESERARLAAEAELLKAERLSVLGQLTATVAHELRNPLSAIRNTMFTVKELATAGGVKLDRPIARIERSIERCDRIIADLLEYTRHRALDRRSVCLDRWVAEVLADQNVAAPVILNTELNAGASHVSIDVDRLRRVVINLVDNAAQAFAELPADREKRITLRTAIGDGEIVLVVEDTGPGIAPENLARVFEPLFSTKSFGTGLGLPTVKQIVNQHDGTIVIDSEVGKGTRVTVRLPLDRDEPETVRKAA